MSQMDCTTPKNLGSRSDRIDTKPNVFVTGRHYSSPTYPLAASASFVRASALVKVELLSKKVLMNGSGGRSEGDAMRRWSEGDRCHVNSPVLGISRSGGRMYRGNFFSELLVLV